MKGKWKYLKQLQKKEEDDEKKKGKMHEIAF